MGIYDSKQDTLDHIRKVQGLMRLVLDNLTSRTSVHDDSKLEQPEKDMYDTYTPLLRDLTYGSDEYKACLVKMGPALQHHYEANSHHPEHYEKGINGMSLLDVIEMLADWKAASQRHADGSMTKSMEINKARFGISEQLFEILQNTLYELGW